MYLHPKLMLRVKTLIRPFLVLILALQTLTLRAGEADIKIPDLQGVTFQVGGTTIGGLTLLYAGLAVCILGALFGLVQYKQTKNLPVHESMRNVSVIIWETCKTYLQQQGKFLSVLWVLIALCMLYYFAGLSHMGGGQVLIILGCSILGILGSYGVAWFGIRINTQANSRSAFAALQGNPLRTLNIPLQSGM